MSSSKLTPPPRHTAGEGFSLLELVVVVTILSILAAIGVPFIGNIIKQSKIDSIKGSLNSAATDCLQKVRIGTDPAEANPSDAIISDDSIAGLGYRISERSCASFFLVPIDPDEKYLYQLGFKISASGDIVKIAVPSSDPGSLNSCKNWAGVNCGVSAEQQAVWDALAKIEKDKKTCNDDFYTWLQKPSSGSFNRWNETTKSCSLETWAFEGSIQKDEAAVKSARLAKIGAACTAKLKEKETARFDGVFTDPECGTTYFCSGKDLLTDSVVAYNACKEEARIQQCKASLSTWKDSKANGKFEVQGCEAAWGCNGTYYSTQTDFDKTSCACTWQDESYQTGTQSENYVCGSTQTRICVRFQRGECTQWDSISNPTYCTRQIPTYGTRRVCK